MGNAKTLRPAQVGALVSSPHQFVHELDEVTLR